MKIYTCVYHYCYKHSFVGRFYNSEMSVLHVSFYVQLLRYFYGAQPVPASMKSSTPSVKTRQAVHYTRVRGAISFSLFYENERKENQININRV